MYWYSATCINKYALLHFKSKRLSKLSVAFGKPLIRVLQGILRLIILRTWDDCLREMRNVTRGCRGMKSSEFLCVRPDLSGTEEDRQTDKQTDHHRQTDKANRNEGLRQNLTGTSEHIE